MLHMIKKMIQQEQAETLKIEQLNEYTTINDNNLLAVDTVGQDTRKMTYGNFKLSLAETFAPIDYVDDLDDQNVKLTGNQTINGSKSFTGYLGLVGATAVARTIGFNNDAGSQVCAIRGQSGFDGISVYTNMAETTQTFNFLDTGLLQLPLATPEDSSAIRKDYVDDNFVGVGGDYVTLSTAQNIIAHKTFNDNISANRILSRNSNMVIAGRTGEDDAIFLRPQGEDASTGEVTIDNAGNISVTAGFVTCPLQPTGANQLTRKDYVDDNFIGRTGDDLNITGRKEFYVPAPTAVGDFDYPLSVTHADNAVRDLAIGVVRAEENEGNPWSDFRHRIQKHVDTTYMSYIDFDNTEIHLGNGGGDPATTDSMRFMLDDASGRVAINVNGDFTLRPGGVDGSGVDFVLNAGGNLSIPSAAPLQDFHAVRKDYVDDNYVSLTTTQAITGTKTFQSSLAVPTLRLHHPDYAANAWNAGFRSVSTGAVDMFCHEDFRVYTSYGDADNVFAFNAGGNFTVPALAPTEAYHATRKDYVDGVLISALGVIADAIENDDTTALRAQIAALQSAI